MKRCILHLGMPKTASTSIQTVLRDNRTLLKNQGWEYPEFKCPQKGNTFFNHNDPLCMLFFPKHPFHVQRYVKNDLIDLDFQRKELYKELNSYCRNSSRLILSSEVLLKPLPLQRIKDHLTSQGYEIEPVIYVRDPFSYRVSLYQSFLKFSQLPVSVIVERLRDAIVITPVQTVRKIFGDTVRIYPFNHLVRSGEDVAKHFLSHLSNSKIFEKVVIKRENKSLSWQATSLLGYIEEHSPLYIDNIKSTERYPGDICPLHQLEGEKFQFVHGQLVLFREVIDQENEWLESNLGEEFCEMDYMSRVASEPVVWSENNVQSLLGIFSKVPVNIQYLIYSYLKDEAIFSSRFLKESTLLKVINITEQKKHSWSFSKMQQFFPAETIRGSIVRRLYRSLKI